MAPKPQDAQDHHSIIELVGITILEPFSGTPGIFFAVENFLKESQTQLLCRVEIGEDLSGSQTIESTIFDDSLNDDKRYYTLTPQGLLFHFKRYTGKISENNTR